MPARATRHILMYFTAVIALLATALSSPAHAEPPAELKRLAYIYATELQKINAQRNQQTAILPDTYLTRLKELQNTFQREGDLDGVLAATNESKRFLASRSAEPDPFEVTPGMPPAAIVATQPALKQLQQSYIQWNRNAADASQQRTDKLNTIYLSRLEALKSELTRQNRIPDALEVKAEVERVRNGVFSGIPVTTPPTTTAAQTGTSAVATNVIPSYGYVPAWAKWKYIGNEKFCGDDANIGDRTIPDELTARYLPRTGTATFSGRCNVNTAVIQMRDCSWFGKALLWEAKQPQDLKSTFIIESRNLANGRDYGPQAQLGLRIDGRVAATFAVPLTKSPVTLSLDYNDDVKQCALSWNDVHRSKKVSIPDGAKVEVFLGVAMRYPGELCDTTVTIK